LSSVLFVCPLIEDKVTSEHGGIVVDARKAERKLAVVAVKTVVSGFDT